MCSLWYVNTCLSCLFWHNCMFITKWNEQKDIWRKGTARYATHSCVHFSGSLPLHHSTLTLSLNSVRGYGYLNLLFPALVQPCMKAKPCYRKKTTKACETSHKAEKSDLCDPLSSLCVWSCPKCFLQNRCNRESSFLWWSLCF